jgi:hypothetical protein
MTRESLEPLYKRFRRFKSLAQEEVRPWNQPRCPYLNEACLSLSLHCSWSPVLAPHSRALASWQPSVA